MVTSSRWKFVLRLLACRPVGVLAQASVGLAGGLAVWLANMVLPRMLPVIQPDSHSYLNFGASRTALYPLFLRFVHDGGSDFQTVLTAQLAIHVVAFAILLFALARVRLPLSALVLFVLAMAFNPFLQSFHHTILTESLTFSLTFLACGAFGLFVGEGRKAYLALTMLFAALAVAAKVGALALLIGLVMASASVLLARQRGARQLRLSLLAMLAPIMLVLVAENRAFFDAHDSRQSVLERHLFGKAALIHAIVPTTTLPPGYEGLEPALLDHRALSRQTMARLYAEAQWCPWLWAHTTYEARAYHRFAEAELSKLERRLAMSEADIKLAVALHVIAENPGAAAKLVGKHYVGFFCAASAGEAESPGPAGGGRGTGPDDAASRLMGIAYIAVGMLFAFVKIFYVVKAALALWRRARWSPVDTFGASMVLCAVGLNLFVAMFSVPIPRFLMASLPLVMIACLCVGTVIIDRLLRPPAV